jgi:hypothetical protein
LIFPNCLSVNISITYISVYVHIYLLVSVYLSIYISMYLSIHPNYLSIQSVFYLPTYLYPIYVCVLCILCICPSVRPLSVYLPTYCTTRLPTYLPTYIIPGSCGAYLAPVKSKGSCILTRTNEWSLSRWASSIQSPPWHMHQIWGLDSVEDSYCRFVSYYAVYSGRGFLLHCSYGGGALCIFGNYTSA